MNDISAFELPAALADVHVVMMCGVSGAGKTYMARKLETAGFERLSADRLVWEKYGESYSSLPADSRSRIYMTAMKALTDSLPEKIAEGKRVVMDSSFCKRGRRDAVARLCREAGVNSLILYLDVPAPLLRRRLAMREGAGPDDQRIPEEDLVRFLQNFEPPAPDERYITLTPETNESD